MKKNIILLAAILTISLACQNNSNSKNQENNINQSEDSYEFLVNINEIILPVTLNLENKDSLINIEKLQFHSEIIKALNEISSESEPFVELPPFSDCLNFIVGKIKLSNSYLLIIRTDQCNLGYKSICGIIINKDKKITGQIVLANYSGGTGSAQELKSSIHDKIINQILTESSWDSSGDTTKDETNFTIDITEDDTSNYFVYKQQ